MTAEAQTVPQPPVDILLVDDREEDLFALKAMLDQPELNVVTARSGMEALKRVLERDFAVILLDVVMPRMDGFEVAAIIKQRARSRYTPILFLSSAGSDISFVYRGYSVGAVDVLVKPVDRDVVRAKISIFVELFRKDRHIENQAAALRDADRRERDVKLAELRLDATQRYYNLAEAIPQIVWTANAKGSVDYCSRRWQELTGLGPDESLGGGWRYALHPDDRDRFIVGWSDAVANAQPYQAECRLRRGSDGAFRWFLCQAVPERDSSGQIVGWLGTYTDCDDLKRAQAAAEATNRRSELLADASVILSSSLDYHETLASVARLPLTKIAEWCLIHVSGAAGSTLAAHVDAGKERHLQQLAMLSSARAHPRAFEPAEMGAAISAPLITREKILGTISIGSTQRQFDGADMAMLQDLARRVAMAVDSSWLYREARQAVGARDEFLSVASHELRTPLTTLILQLQSLQRMLGDAQNQNGDDRSRAKLDVSIRQTHRLERLIDSLLDVSRIATGHLELQLEEFDIAKAVREIADRLAEEAARAGCRLELRADHPAFGRWDRMRLEQVVTNLFSNALKYAAGKPLEITVEAEAQMARLKVQDHGMGIAADDLKRIFDRFERAVPTQHYGGLGMGLYITRQIVEAHGGSIRVSSQLGSGATFTVELPQQPLLSAGTN